MQGVSKVPRIAFAPLTLLPSFHSPTLPHLLSPLNEAHVSGYARWGGHLGGVQNAPAKCHPKSREMMIHGESDDAWLI